jgi:hypothetical protein
MENEMSLLTNTERFDNDPIALDIIFSQIIEQVTPLADQLEQSPSRMMIFLMRLEMLCQIRDPVAEKRNLHLRRAGVFVMRSELLNYLLFSLSVQWHDTFILFFVVRSPSGQGVIISTPGHQSTKFMAHATLVSTTRVSPPEARACT